MLHHIKRFGWVSNPPYEEQDHMLGRLGRVGDGGLVMKVCVEVQRSGKAAEWMD